MTTVPFSRRTLIAAMGVGGLAAGWPGLPASGAPVALAYDSPEAFDVAEAAFLAQDRQDNETGGYAWGASYYLLGLIRMYEKYGDAAYLDRFVAYADHVWATTDQARGVTDHAGRSGPVWRAGGNYTAAHGELTDDQGSALIQVRWAGSAGSTASVTVSAVTGDRFTLTLRPPTGNPIELLDVSLDPADPRYVVDQVQARYTTGARWTALDLRTDPGPGTPIATTIGFEQQFYCFAVHTGMVTYPIARYAALVLGSPLLRRGRHRGRAQRYLASLRRAIAFHDDEFAVDDQGRGDYVWPKGAPVPFDGTIQPYNQSQGLGQTMAVLHGLVGGGRYAQQVEALIASMRDGLVLDADGAYVWPYWPVHSELYRGFSAPEELSTYTPSYTPARQFEDISHAAITVEFLVAAHEVGLGGLEADLPRFARTYTQNLVRSQDQVWLRVDGTTDAAPANAVQSARWGALAPWDPAITDHALRVWQREGLTPDQGSHALAIAYLNPSST